MGRLLTVQEHQRMTDEFDKVKYKCKCGHSVIISKKFDKKICSWCGKYVFKNKEDEFKYRMKEKMREYDINN